MGGPGAARTARDLDDREGVDMSKGKHPLVICTGCERLRPHTARGLCTACYSRWRRDTRPTVITCLDCHEETALQARGRCNRCYQRALVRGLPPIEIWTPPTTPPVGPPTFGDPRLPERFWSKLRITEEGCWEWTAAVFEGGYGQFRVSRDLTRQVHLLTYEILVGPIPEGLVADHLCHTNDPTCYDGLECRHRRCANPTMLEFVTPEENSRRAHWPRQSHCSRGHRYVAFTKHGWGRCRICENANARARGRARRAARKAVA